MHNKFFLALFVNKRLQIKSNHTAQKSSFPLRILNPQFTVDLVTFTEEILNGKFHFLIVSILPEFQ